MKELIWSTADFLGAIAALVGAAALLCVVLGFIAWYARRHYAAVLGWFSSISWFRRRAPRRRRGSWFRRNMRWVTVSGILMLVMVTLLAWFVGGKWALLTLACCYAAVALTHFLLLRRQGTRSLTWRVYRRWWTVRRTTKAISILMAVALFGLLGLLFSESLLESLAAVSTTQKVVLGGVVAGILYWADRRSWWGASPSKSHAAGRWAFRGVTIIYALYIICLLLGIKLPSLDVTLKTVQNYYDSISVRDLLPFAAGTILAVAVVCAFLFHTRWTLVLASIAALGFFGWHYGDISMPEPAKFQPSVSAPAPVAEVQVEKGAKPVVEMWDFNKKFPRIPANFDKMTDAQQLIEKKKWLTVTYLQSGARATPVMPMPTQYPYAIGVDGDHVTMVCFYRDGTEYRFKVNREDPCPNNKVVAFQLISELVDDKGLVQAKHTVLYMFKWVGDGLDPKQS